MLAYAGSLDDSAAVAWLAEHHQAEVVTVTLDVGQERDVAHVRDRAIACGAVRTHVVDAREEFARDCVLPWLQGVALDEPGCAALVRPLVARKLAEAARLEGTSVVAHGSKGGAFDLAIAAADPTLRVVAPTRERAWAGVDGLAYARMRGLMVPPSSEREDLVESHLLRRHAPAHRRGVETAAHLEIEFEDGVPRAVNGVALPLTELIESLSVIASDHGVGRIGAIDAPAAAVLHTAYGVVGRQSGVVRLKLFKGEQSLETHA